MLWMHSSKELQMIRRYRRLPAVAVLVLATGLGALYVWRARAALEPSDAVTLEQLERKAASGAAGPGAWYDYAKKLMAASPPRYADAALAYSQVLKADPFHRDARIGRVSALAQGGKADELYTFLCDLLASDPKLVTELLERHEARPFLAEARFAALQKDARAQAMD